MPTQSSPNSPRRAVSPLDHRFEAATGHDSGTLWAFRDRDVLDEPHAHLGYQQRELAQAHAGRRPA